MAETRNRTVLEIGVDDRALRQLGPTMERALNPKVAEAFEKSLERSTAALTKMVEQQAKLGKMVEQQAKAGQQRTRENDRSRRDDERRQTRATRNGVFQSDIMTDVRHAATRVAGNMPYHEGFIGQALSGIPYIGPAFQGILSGAQGFYQSFAQQQIARSRAFGSTGLGSAGYKGLQGIGNRLGLGPSELPGALQGLGQAAGLRGAGLAGIAPQALQAQTYAGIDVGASGSLVNAVLAATQGIGGDANAGAEDRSKDILTEAIAAGLTGGIREARLSETLQQIGQSVTQLRTQGIMIDVSDTLALMRGLGSIGGSLSGEAGAAAAQSITRGFSGAADKTGWMSALAIRERMRTHNESYMDAARGIESNPAEAFRSVLGIVRGMAASDPDGAQWQLREGAQGLGIQLGRQQAYDLLHATDTQLAGMAGATPNAGSQVDGFMSDRFQRIQGVLGTAAAEANYESQRVDVGAGAAGVVRANRNLEMSVIREFAPQMNAFAQGMLREVKGLFDAFRAGGIPGMMSHIAERVTEHAIPAAVDAVGEAGQAAYDALDRSTWGTGMDVIQDTLHDTFGIGDGAQKGGGGGSGGVRKQGGSGKTSVEIIIVDRTSNGITTAR